MTVNIEKVNDDWRLIIIPEDDIERAIIKTKNGSHVSLVTDMKSHGSHIADCLVISSRPEKEVTRE